VSSSLKEVPPQFSCGPPDVQPIRNSKDREEAERILAGPPSARPACGSSMNGARGIPETLAQKRIYIGTLRGWRRRPRSRSALRWHAADLLPAEVPCQGLTSAAILPRDSLADRWCPFFPIRCKPGRRRTCWIMARAVGEDLHGPVAAAHVGPMGTQISILGAAATPTARCRTQWVAG